MNPKNDMANTRSANGRASTEDGYEGTHIPAYRSTHLVHGGGIGATNPFAQKMQPI